MDYEKMDYEKVAELSKIGDLDAMVELSRLYIMRYGKECVHYDTRCWLGLAIIENSTRAENMFKLEYPNDDLEQVFKNVYNRLLNSPVKDQKWVDNHWEDDCWTDYHLGNCYYYGKGVEKNLEYAKRRYKNAKKWIAEASQNADEDSQGAYNAVLDKIDKKLTEIENLNQQ